MAAADRAIVYGAPPAELAPTPIDAIQVWPLSPGSTDIATLADESLAEAVIYAPPGTLERRFVLAQALRATRPGAPMTVLAPKDRGGARLGDELRAFGCDIRESGRRHHRLCAFDRPRAPRGLAEAIAAGAPQWVEALGLWSQPGVFSWDRLDPGSALLLEQPMRLAGAGADLGCGAGVLARAALAQPAVKRLTLVDIDRRAIEAARRNLDDPRASFAWADAREAAGADLDFVIMNPPFHEGAREERGLGAAFIAAAARSLRRGGVCRLVANVALPYEPVLIANFAAVSVLARGRGYKVFEARK